MQFELKKMILPKGREFSYIETGDPLGIPLILLHGLGDSCRTFEALLPHFPGRIRAIAYTQRGHDGIDPPDATYRVRDFEADLLAFMSGLALQKAFILGASSGGFIARNFAVRNPKRVHGLILAGSPSALGDKPEVIEIHKSSLSRLADPVPMEFVKRLTDGLFAKPVPADFLQLMYSESQKVPARVWKETSEALLKEEFPDRLAQIKAPALVICGGKDTIASRADQEKLARAIPDSRLTVFPQLGHLLYWEDPKNVSKEITSFIVGVWSGPEGAKFEYE